MSLADWIDIQAPSGRDQKIRYIAGYPLTLGSHNAGASHFFPKVHRKYAISE